MVEQTKAHIYKPCGPFAVAKQSDIIPTDGETGLNKAVKPKLVVGRNAAVIYGVVSTANGHKIHWVHQGPTA